MQWKKTVLLKKTFLMHFNGSTPYHFLRVLSEGVALCFRLACGVIPSFCFAYYFRERGHTSIFKLLHLPSAPLKRTASALD